MEKAWRYFISERMLWLQRDKRQTDCACPRGVLGMGELTFISEIGCLLFSEGRRLLHSLFLCMCVSVVNSHSDWQSTVPMLSPTCWCSASLELTNVRHSQELDLLAHQKSQFLCWEGDLGSELLVMPTWEPDFRPWCSRKSWAWQCMADPTTKLRETGGS